MASLCAEQRAGTANGIAVSDLSYLTFDNLHFKAGVTAIGGSSIIDIGGTSARTVDCKNNSLYGKFDRGPLEYQPPYTMGTDQIDIAGHVRIYASGRFRNKAAPSGTLANLAITPSAGFLPTDYRQWMDIAVTEWAATKTWTETSPIAGETAHTVKGLTPNTVYTVTVDGSTIATPVSDRTGMINFTYSGGYAGMKTFRVTGG